MELSHKPLKWDELAAQHDPDSLPFWRFYEEMQRAQRRPRLLQRWRQWLQGTTAALQPHHG